MKLVNLSKDVCSFCILVQELIKTGGMEHKDWQLFYMHLKMEHLWVEEISV
jgi:hypothetical protein